MKTINSTSITNEVKRVGYLLDTNTQPQLEFREGDELVVYLQVQNK